jgi:hypothetical protein
MEQSAVAAAICRGNGFGAPKSTAGGWVLSTIFENLQANTIA